MYVIFRALGKQFRAEKGQTLRLPLMAAEPGAKVTFGEVLLASDGDTIKRPGTWTASRRSWRSAATPPTTRSTRPFRRRVT